jgi:adenosylcobalamin phosphodiesterase
MRMTPEFQDLPRSWKKRYPFRTGTTSFIYPAGYTENVARLGPYVDEIEILMFESGAGSRPTEALVRDLASMGNDYAITYNIHLPIDLVLTHPDKSHRRKACRILQQFITILMPLDPTVYVLHLSPPDTIQDNKDLSAWQNIAADTLREILLTGLSGRQLAIENLFYPYAWLDLLIEAYDLGVCLDTGHLALQSGDIEAFLGQYGPRIAIGHLHGLRNGQDHSALTGLPDNYKVPLINWLRGFTGSVSLEVFAFQPLLESLTCLDRMMAHPDRSAAPNNQ